MPGPVSSTLTGTTASTASLQLRHAILSNDVPLVERLLKAYPHLVHNPDYNDKSNTSLHLAAKAGYTELVELLISEGHDQSPEVTDYIYSSAGNNLGVSVNTDGQTALHLAASSLRVDTVELLCTEFPNTIDRPDHRGRTPLLLAAGAQAPVTTKVVRGRKNTLQSNEDVGVVEALLRHGANVRARDHQGDTCLHQACAWGNLKTARVLVQAGADPLASNNAGWKPDAYSLSVQADVYFRNLVAEVEKRKAEDMQRRREGRRTNTGGGGQVRLVQEPVELEDEPEPLSDADTPVQSRTKFSRTESTNEQSRDRQFEAGGLNISTGGGRLLSAHAWK
ncbi:hypothetical protein LTR64_001145 [Lithohypha guttulata]|uniref:uncharacterized protein n=1 Tax=Lithohypha guttulata TaxID=1690604 RepID=UPI002DE0E8FA|nr:hypothetical protein LTR51_003339 [Lithohypha guttulata]